MEVFKQVRSNGAAFMLFLFVASTVTTADGSKSWLHDNKNPSTMLQHKFEPEGAFVRGNNECVSELYDIQEAEALLSIKDILLSKPRTYILCPDTVYDIADSFDTDRRPRDGKQAPLIIGRSHIYIKCGETGSSSNKCVFRGGHFQVHLSPLFLSPTRDASEDDGGDFSSSATSSATTTNNRDERPILNAVLQGITFTEAGSFNVLAEYPGELLLQDCIFRDNQAISLIFGHVLAKNRVNDNLRRRELLTKESFRREFMRHRQRQRNLSKTPPALKIRVNECLFEVSSRLRQNNHSDREKEFV